MEKVLYWKIQVTNQTPELEVGSLEMKIYKAHYLKDYTTGESMTDAEAQEHYKINAWKNPLFSKMHSLTLAFVDKDKIRVNHFTGSEADLLKQFINTAKSPYFNDFKMACFDAEYLLPYLGIRMDKNNIREILPADMVYRNLRPWNLTGTCIRSYYQGAGAYKPTLTELAYIYNLENNIDLRRDEVTLYLNGDVEALQNNAIEEIRLLINIHRKMNHKNPIEDFEVKHDHVENITVEEPKTLLHELYETKNFDSNFQERLKAHLKKRKMLKKEKPVVEKLICASYFEKIDVTDFKKKDKEEINEARRKEVQTFMEQL